MIEKPFTINERRASERFFHESPIMHENHSNGIFYAAKMYNYSNNGMYFETDLIHRPGEEISIDFDNPPHRSRTDVLEGFGAEVVWCKEVAGAKSIYKFGVGVKFYEPLLKRTASIIFKG
jgi:Tfp pilus assembly protein PilZ